MRHSAGNGCLLTPALRRVCGCVWLATALVVGARPGLAQAPVPPAAPPCFPFEQLPARLQARAEQLLLTALDGEALYTIASDIKPMSSGIEGFYVDVATPSLGAVSDLREILATWTCGGRIQASVYAFATVRDGKRYMDTVVFRPERVAALVAAEPAFFGAFGLTANASPLEVALAVEHDGTPARFRGYGWLFGYPAHAVDFFVQAAEAERAGRGFVTRDFITLPTVRGEHRFVYAVPKGHVPNAADAALRQRAQAVFDDYTRRRARHIIDGSPRGVVTLVREWLAR